MIYWRLTEIKAYPDLESKPCLWWKSYMFRFCIQARIFNTSATIVDRELTRWTLCKKFNHQYVPLTRGFLISPFSGIFGIFLNGWIQSYNATVCCWFRCVRRFQFIHANTANRWTTIWRAFDSSLTQNRNIFQNTSEIHDKGIQFSKLK